MSHNRYPEDLMLTAEDFFSCGWRTALAGAGHKGYPPMWEAFSAAAKQATQNGQQVHGKALWLLADACSMMLSSASANEPFKPFAVFPPRRSTIPDDFHQADIAFFSRIVDTIDDPWLKARLADLVWLIQHRRDVKFALMAIDSYRSIQLDTETWLHDGAECWQRAISLAKMLGTVAGGQLATMEASTIGAFESATRNDGFLSLWLADLLKSNALAGSHSTNIATKLESLAREFEGEGNLDSAREYFRASADWFKASGDDAQSTAMTVAMAEGWVKEAIARASSDQPSHMVAASFYENAIQTYRAIPRSERAVHGVDERITDLQKRLNKSGEKSLDEMGAIVSPGMDITHLAEIARNAVKDKAPIDALKAFVNLCSVMDAKKSRESATKQLRSYPLQALFPATVMSRDGRVIAKRPGMVHSATSSDDDEMVIRFQMSQDYGIRVGIVVQGHICPALEVLLLEHRLRESEFIDLAKQSPIVPMGREALFGRALFAGYDRDFAVALHLLLPQIEHMVRFHLKQASATTTNLDTNGIENENGLNSLMDLPEAEKIFGRDLSFEIRALFCSSTGPNLRNQAAHGLLDDDACQSIYAIYAWWLGLKLVFNTFWNASRSDAESSEQGQEP